MKTLAQYLAEYVSTEVERSQQIEGFGSWDTGNMQQWLEQGIEAYQSTENCKLAICGEDCPDCSKPMVYKDAVVYAGADEIECGSYECPECGYVVYG